MSDKQKRIQELEEEIVRLKAERDEWKASFDQTWADYQDFGKRMCEAEVAREALRGEE